MLAQLVNDSTERTTPHQLATPLRDSVWLRANGESVVDFIISKGSSVNACSALHDVVHNFRRTHGLTEKDIYYQTDKYKDVLSLYPVERAALQDRAGVEMLSQPEVYQSLRHGERLMSPYPPLADRALRQLTAEIRAALVWSSCSFGM